MSLPEEHLCAECGRSLPDQSLGQRCPNCLLQLALTPPPEELVAATPVMARERGNGERRFFAGYELQGEIARGGMGVVYRARQFQPDRSVALKMIHPAGRATPAARLRFEVEIAAVARLHHPRIVSLYESGEHEGVCFYSMRLVEGDGLDVWLAEKRLPDSRAARVDLLVKVAEAVQYAHDRGILHRDLKPSNVLLGQDGEPCIADFGLAKIQEADAGITQDRSVLGSPSYMAPEQAAGDGAEITIAADVYSLGAILYELLTGRPPFLADNPLETLRRVKEEPPVPPRQLAPSVPRDLESICLKALEKEPSRRYASAQALADDLRRWRRGEQVQARPISTLAQAWRWCRRRPAVAALLVVSLVSLITLAVGSTIVARRFQVEGQAKQALVHRLQHEKAESYLATGETGKGLAVLAYLLRENPANDVAGNRLLSALNRRSLAVPIVPPWIGGAEVLAVGFSADGAFSSTIARNGNFRRLELATGRTWDAALLPAGESLLMAHMPVESDWLITVHHDGRVCLRSVLQPDNVIAALPHDTPVKLLAADSHARSIVTVDQRDRISRWTSVDGRGWKGVELPLPADGAILAVTLDLQGRQLAVGNEGGRVFWVDLAATAFTFREFATETGVRALAFSHGGGQLAAADGEFVFLWRRDRAAGEGLRLPMLVATTELDFSPDDSLLAGAGWARSRGARVWETANGRVVADSLAHNSHVTVVRFNPAGDELVTLSHDHEARRWAVGSWAPVGEPMVHVSTPLQLAFAADGRRLVTGTYTGTVWWDVSPAADRPAELMNNDTVIRAAYSPDGRRIAAGTMGGLVHLWDAVEGRRLRTIVAQTNEVLFLDFNHAGDAVLAFGRDGVVRTWRVEDGGTWSPSIAHPEAIYSAAFSADDRRLLTAGTDGVARIWDVASGGLKLKLGEGASLLGAGFSPDESHVVTHGHGETIRLWDARTGQPMGAPIAIGPWVYDAAFSPDGRWLAACGQSSTVTLWDVATGRKLGEPLRHQNEVVKIAFSPDGRRLASASLDATVQVVSLGGEETVPLLIPQPVAATWVAFSPDSRWLVAMAQDGTARVWDAKTGLPVTEPMPHAASANARAHFSPDGTEVLTVGGDQRVLRWALPRYRVAASEALVAAGELVGRLKLVDDHRFTVAPLQGWEKLPVPFERRALLNPAAGR